MGGLVWFVECGVNMKFLFAAAVLLAVQGSLVVEDEIKDISGLVLSRGVEVTVTRGDIAFWRVSDAPSYPSTFTKTCQFTFASAGPVPVRVNLYATNALATTFGAFFGDTQSRATLWPGQSQPISATVVENNIGSGSGKPCMVALEVTTQTAEGTTAAAKKRGLEAELATESVTGSLSVNIFPTFPAPPDNPNRVVFNFIMLDLLARSQLALLSEIDGKSSLN